MFGRKQAIQKKKFLTHFDPSAPPIIIYENEVQSGGSDLVYGIVRYVNLMMEDGLYDPHRLPQKLMQSYHADLYLSQVNNGGHSQYTGNIGPRLPETNANIALGLQAMKADSYLEVFRRYQTWLITNPRQASQQTGFGDVPEFLNNLDNEFYDLNKVKALSDLNAAWILSWPDLRTVEDKEDYKWQMQTLFDANPHKESIAFTREIRTYAAQLEEGQRMILNMAGWRSGGIFVENMRPGNYTVIEGEEVAVFPVDTNKGTLLGVFGENWAGFYTSSKTGEYNCVERVTTTEVQEARNKAIEYKAGAAVHLLLQKANFKGKVVALCPHLGTDNTGIRRYAIVLMNLSSDIMLTIPINEHGAKLISNSRGVLAEVTRQEILAHAAYAQ